MTIYTTLTGMWNHGTLATMTTGIITIKGLALHTHKEVLHGTFFSKSFLVISISIVYVNKKQCYSSMSGLKALRSCM